MFKILITALVVLMAQPSMAMEDNASYSRDWTFESTEKNKTHQPSIKAFAWGIFTIEDTQGKEHTFGAKRNERGYIRLWPNGFDKWDWRTTKTQHHPGVQPEDFKDLLNDNIEALILSRGVENVLHTDSAKLVAFIAELKKENTKLQVLELLTPDAIIEYNKLIGKGKKVVAVLHATC